MKKLAFFILVLFGLQTLYGQGAKYIVRNYDLLSEVNLNGSTWTLIQDTNGVLYFGSDFGLVTYNGAYWELASKGQTIIRSLYYDSQKRIVYGGFDDFGFIDHSISDGFVFRSVAGLLPDSLKEFGDIWNISEIGRKLFFQSKTRIFILEDGQIKSIRVSDCYHRAYTLDGSYLINQSGIGLTYFDGKGFQLMKGGAFFNDKIISCLIGRPDKRILVGCRNEGLYLLDPSTGEIGNPFPDHPGTSSELARNKIYHGISLPDNKLAIATLSGGTFFLNPDGEIQKVLNRNHGLRDNVNYFLGLSRDFNLWICTSNGISSFNINSPFILWDYTSGIDGVVLDIVDYQKNIFIGTLTGLYEISGSLQDQSLLREGAKRLINSEVWSMARVFKGGKSFLFIGSGSGLYQLDNMVPVLINKGDLILKLIHLRADPDVLLAMHADNIDIYRWNGSTFNFQKQVGHQFNGFRTASEDNKGNLWVGTRNAEVVQIPIKELLYSSIHPRSFSLNGKLTDLIEYQDEALFSNSDGLFSFNYTSGNFEKTQLFGPEIAGIKRMISTLKKDSRGNIWVGGEDIFLARPDGTYTMDKLNFQELKDVFSAFVFLHTPDQRTWIGGNNGVYLYDNRINLRFPVDLQTIINRIVVHQDTILFLNAASPEQVNQGFLNIPNKRLLEIDLTKRNSQVTFSYSLPFFENEKHSSYSYKLEGYDDAWSEWSSGTEVTFSNLKPAEYRFQVKGKTIYNQIGQPAEVRFSVPRPWYFFKIIIVLYVLTFALVIYLIARYISRISIQKHLQIEDIIRKRIQESNRAHMLSLMNTHSGQPEDPTEFAGQPGLNPASQNLIETKEQQFLAFALKILELHMENHNLTAGLYCKELGMSQAKVYRKLISTTGMSINEFIRNIRLKKAAQLLIETDLPISEIAYKTGFNSPGYFTKCFTAEFGKNPRDFSQKRHLS